MKKLLSINLGLNNNPFSFTQLQEYFYNNKNYTLLSSYKARKEYKGELEPTFVAVLEYDYSRDSKVIQDFENLCTVFNQECIAISTDSFDIMVFNPSYQGKKFFFSERLFERPLRWLVPNEVENLKRYQVTRLQNFYTDVACNIDYIIQSELSDMVQSNLHLLESVVLNEI